MRIITNCLYRVRITIEVRLGTFDYERQMFVRFLQSFMEPVPAIRFPVQAFIYIRPRSRCEAGRPILLRRTKRGMDVTRTARNYAIDTVEIGRTYGVLLERSPLVTGLAVIFLFVQNREAFGPLADNVSCANLGEFFEDSANLNRYARFAKTIINFLISALRLLVRVDKRGDL